MNNLNLRHRTFAKLSLSTIIFLSASAQVRADTLYGPLSAGETLSSIVNENYLVSPFEDRVIMGEIFRLNPQAFINNNMGLVRQGVMLTLPSDATIRRSQGSSVGITSSTTASSIAQQAVPEASVLAQSLNETLTQVRRERDQVQVALNRLQAESEAQKKALNSKIEQLSADSQSTTRQLGEAQSEIAQLKQSLDLAREENNQLAIKAEQAATPSGTNELISSQLEESKLLIAQKEKQVSDLEAVIEKLEQTADEANRAHEAAIAELRNSYEALEAQLGSQIQAGANNDDQSGAVATAKVEALNSQHQQALSELQASFDAEIAQKTNLQESLKSELDAAKVDIGANETELATLRDTNKELERALSESISVKDALAANATTSQETDLIGLTETATVDKLLTGPLSKELLVQEMEKPVAFPLWGLLLGAFALGFTSLMMFFKRSRRTSLHAVESTQATKSKIEPTILTSEDEKNALVFRAANENAVPEPDVETLRVPPRRDPSRVAILDPSMVATTSAAVAVASLQSNAELLESNAAAPKEALEVSSLTPYQSTEAKLKLLLAETYAEIDNIPAANELIDEVKQEGGEEYRDIADSLLERMIGGKA